MIDFGMVEICLILYKILGFGYVLEFYDKLVDIRLFEGCVFFCYVKNEVIFIINLLRKGLYYFFIYMGDYWYLDCFESVVLFLINCIDVIGVFLFLYFLVLFYGLILMMDILQIEISNQLDLLIVLNGELLDIIFKFLKDVKIMYMFQYFDVSDSLVLDIDWYVFLCLRIDIGVIYMVRCLKEGYYIFFLYVVDENNEILDCVYRYLVIC